MINSKLDKNQDIINSNKTTSPEKLDNQEETGHRVQDIVSELIISQWKQIITIDSNDGTGQAFNESHQFVTGFEW